MKVFSGLDQAKIYLLRTLESWIFLIFFIWVMSFYLSSVGFSIWTDINHLNNNLIGEVKYYSYILSWMVCLNFKRLFSWLGWEKIVILSLNILLPAPTKQNTSTLLHGGLVEILDGKYHSTQFYVHIKEERGKVKCHLESLARVRIRE